MLNHCNNDFRPYDVWYLNDIKEITRHNDKTGNEDILRDGFYNRCLYLGKCPVCKKDVVILSETRQKDGQIFQDKAVGEKSQSLVDKVINQVNFTRQEVKIKKGKPYKWTYAENKEIHNNQGKVIAIRRKACDWYGQKEVREEIRL